MTALPQAVGAPALLEFGARYAAALDVIGNAIASDGPVFCVGHVQPDGDALGSALALALAITRAGGRAFVTFDPGELRFGLPPSLAFLPGAQLLVAPDQLSRRAGVPAAVITLDAGSLERLGRVAPLATPRPDGPPVLVVDHHAQGSEFGSLRLVDPHAAATAELVAALIDGLGVAFDEDIASCLYTGLASDTGSFRYAATTPGSHQLAARLLAAGARHDAISSLLWDSRPASYLVVLTGALERVRRVGELIWTHVSAAHLKAADASVEEIEGIVDVIRVDRNHEVALVLKQDCAADPGGPKPEAGAARWKVSVRSRGRVDVGAACTALGGGGHRLAAGFTAEGEPAEIVARLVKVLAAVG